MIGQPKALRFRPLLDHLSEKSRTGNPKKRFWTGLKKSSKKGKKKRCWRAAQINGPKSGCPLITKKLFPKGKRYTKEQLLSDDFTTRTSATTPLRALGGHGGGYRKNVCSYTYIYCICNCIQVCIEQNKFYEKIY